MNQPTQTRTIAPINEVRQAIESTAMRSEIAKALPPHVSVDKFTRIMMTAIQGNTELLNYDRQSLYAAAMKCAQAGLLPDGREAALVPFKGKIQFMPMVEGLMKQVRNSGELANISVQIVKEHDTFDYELGDNERMIHRPKIGDRGETIGAYSIATLKNGEKSREWMDIAQIRAVMNRGAAGGPWKTDFDEMARKTVFRRHYKRLPKSTDIDDLIREDDEEIAAQTTPPPAVTSRPSALQAVVDAGKTVEVQAEVVTEAPKSDTNGDII